MTDRLALIRARHAEAGGGDADKCWLIAEVERLRGTMVDFPLGDRVCAYGCGPCRWEPGPWHERGCPSWRPNIAQTEGADAVRATLDEALNSGRGEYRP